MSSTDPGSLQNLNDIVMPSAVGWWPLATGWYVLAGLLLLFLAWMTYRLIRQRRANRYRRIALDELQKLSLAVANPSERDASLRALPALLKRTALSVYPRQKVAALSGQKWHDFLNRVADSEVFTMSRFETLETIAYSGGDLTQIDTAAADDLIEAIRQWLRSHRIKPAEISQGEQ